MGATKIGTGRENSSDWSVNDNITAARLQDINEDLDDLYAYGDDRGRVVKASSLSALKVDVGAFSYIIGTTYGTHAGTTDLSLTNNATNYVECDSAGTISVNTSGFSTNSARLATVVTSGGSISTITLNKVDVIGGNLNGGGVVSISSNDTTQGYLNGKLVAGTGMSFTENNDGSAETLTLTPDVKFGGTGADGAISGSLTVTGTDATYIIKNYTTFAPGNNTVTITPVNCVLHIKVQGNCDLTNTTFSFSGKGAAGGSGGASQQGSTGNAGSNGNNGIAPILWAKAGVLGSGASGSTGGAGGTAQTQPFTFGLSASDTMMAGRMIPFGPGSGGGGGGSGTTTTGVGASGAGGAGGAGGGCVIMEVRGNLTFSSTTLNFSGATGSNGGNGSGAPSNCAGGGGGGGGGSGGGFYCMYNGTLTGSATPNVAGGSGGSGGTSQNNDPGNPRASGGGGSGGTSQFNTGNNGASGNTSASGGDGGSGGAGSYAIIKNTVYS